METLEPPVVQLRTSAPSLLAAISNEDRVRVLFSKKRLATTFPESFSDRSSERSICSARVRRLDVCAAEAFDRQEVTPRGHYLYSSGAPRLFWGEVDLGPLLRRLELNLPVVVDIDNWMIFIGTALEGDVLVVDAQAPNLDQVAVLIQLAVGADLVERPLKAFGPDSLLGEVTE